MSHHNRYVSFLTALLPAGAFGLSLALASNAAKATATEGEAPRLDNGTNTRSVANELQAIRDAVDEASTEIADGRIAHTGNPDVRLAWWLNGNGLGWGNGGAVWGNGGYPPWGNVRPWGNGWGNGGWGNGGGWHNWRNGGWRN
jgi:hypothetical protein